MYVLDSSGEENDAVGPAWIKSANVAEGRRRGVDRHTLRYDMGNSVDRALREGGCNA